MTVRAALADKLVPLDAVPAMVPDSSVLFLGGFSIYRAPLGLVRELARSRPRDLTVWSHIGGVGIEMLLAVDAVRCVRSSYVGLDIVGFAPLFTSAIRENRIDFVEETEATLMMGIKATIYNLPHMPARALIGSDIVGARDDLHEYVCPLSGEHLVALPPVSADVAFIHAQVADRAGNTQISGTMGIDIEIAKVSSRVIVSAERVVDSQELLATADATRLPGHLVDAVVELPGGAYPSSCQPRYDVDLNYLIRYIDDVEADGLADYLRREIDGPPFPAYVAEHLPVHT